jgi:iron complex transport system ATP-binding protein
VARRAHALEDIPVTALLEARNLGLPGRLQPTDLLVEGPQLVCLVGPNGSGKTSLLHALARVGRPGGEVRIGGLDPDRLAPDARKRAVAYLPASHDVAWPLEAWDLIRLGLPSDIEAGAAEEAIAAMDLSPFLARRVDQLSTGERSRVLIARALAARAKLLLLDEPGSNLDPQWQLRLMELLRGISREQGIVAALHDLNLAARYADRLIILDAGRIVADGKPVELIAGAQIRSVFGIARGPEGWVLA